MPRWAGSFISRTGRLGLRRTTSSGWVPSAANKRVDALDDSARIDKAMALHILELNENDARLVGVLLGATDDLRAEIDARGARDVRESEFRTTLDDLAALLNA
jgi:hypothetical protein